MSYLLLLCVDHELYGLRCVPDERFENLAQAIYLLCVVAVSSRIICIYPSYKQNGYKAYTIIFLLLDPWLGFKMKNQKLYKKIELSPLPTKKIKQHEKSIEPPEISTKG